MLIFRSVLGSQQDPGESTESSHMPFGPHICTASPLLTFPPLPQSRTFVIIDEPALTCHTHPQVHSLHYSSPLVWYQFSSVAQLCLTLCNRLGQMDNDICPSYDIMQSISTALKMPSICSFLLPRPRQPLIFSMSA